MGDGWIWWRRVRREERRRRAHTRAEGAVAGKRYGIRRERVGRKGKNPPSLRNPGSTGI
jgi:hypothetical protein